MSWAWQGGCPDRQDPQAPLGSPLGSDIQVVQPPTSLLPQQYVLASPDSWHPPPAQAQEPKAALDEWYDAKPGSAEVEWPEDTGVGAAVQWADEAPKSPFALPSGGAEAFAAFLDITDKAGFPRNAAQLRWGDHKTKQAHMNEIARVMEGLYKTVNWEFIYSFHEMKDNWNLQTGSICCYIEQKFLEEGGYHKQCMDHLAACIGCMQQWHKSTKHNKSLPAFKKKMVQDHVIKSVDDYDYYARKDELREYCKTCEHMTPFRSGMSGCWYPPFHFGQTFCVHVKVPTFLKQKKADMFKDCEDQLYKMCVRHHAIHVWKSMCDCHPSEESGQSQADVFRNTHGCFILCKFMITEGTECLKFHELASGTQVENPWTGDKVSFASELTDHSKQKRFKQEKHQKPDPNLSLFFKGTKLEDVPMGPKIGRNPVESGSQSFTSSRDAGLLKEHVAGSQLAKYEGPASSSRPAPAPVRQLYRFHTEDSWWTSLCGVMNGSIAKQVHLLPMVQQFGKLLFDDNRMQLTMLLVRKLSQDLRDDPTFKLVKTNSYFSLPSHRKVLDEQDANCKMVCSHMLYAAFELGNYAITCNNVTNWTQLFKQDECNSNRPSVHDGQGPIEVENNGQLEVKHSDLAEYCVFLVFKWNDEGVYVPEHGFGIGLNQFCQPVFGPERTNLMNMLNAAMANQVGQFMVQNAAMWNSTPAPKAVPVPKKAPPPLPEREVPVQLVPQQGEALQTIQAVFPQPPKAPNLAASAPPTIQLENVRLAEPLAILVRTMPIAQPPPVVDHAVVEFKQRPLTVGANSNMHVSAKAPPPPKQQLPLAGPPPPPPGPPPVQPKPNVVPSLQLPEAKPKPVQPPPPLPQGVTLNNGVLGCQFHWQLQTSIQGRGVCLVCDYCYDRQHGLR